MMRFAGRRVLWLAVTLLVAGFAIFGALYLAPGDPATLLAGAAAAAARGRPPQPGETFRR